MTTITVIGLGKLGSPIAACLASRGYRVIGADSDPRKVAAINEGVPPVFEPGLAELMSSCRGQLLATRDVEAAVAEAQATFIVVPTPGTPEGDFSLEHVLKAAEAAGAALGGSVRAPVGAAILGTDRPHHLLVLTSTVPPGSTEGPVMTALEKASGKRCGTDFGLCYSPGFLSPGSVIHDFLNPDFLLIGESDSRTGDALESIYRRVCHGSPPVARMGFVNAELAKLAVSAFATTRISYANMLAWVCERLPGGDVDTVTAAIGLDSRIGPRYMKGAIGYGGPCLPRDNRAFMALARSLRVPADITEATDRLNQYQTTLLSELIRYHLPAEGVVGILGLSYKPGSDVVDESPGVRLVRELLSAGARVNAHDPAAAGHAVRMLGDRAQIAASAEACIEGSDVVALMTPWTDYRNLPAAVWSRQARPRVVVDCWRALPDLEGAPGVHYVPLGRGGGLRGLPLTEPSMQPIPTGRD